MPLAVNKCCFCVDLRTGCLIIGYFNLLWHIMVTAIVTAYLVAASLIAADSEGEDTEIIVYIAVAILAIALLFVVLNVIFNILMLVGIHQDKPGLVKAYLIYATIFIVYAIVSIGVSIFQGNKAYEIVTDIFSLMFTLYFLIVIRSYYLQMNEAPPVMEEYE